MVMPWGKYIGKRLETVPAGYLGWVAEESDAAPGLRQAVRTELARRFASNGHTTSRPHGHTVSGVCPHLQQTARTIIEAGFKRCAGIAHPDHGGDNDTMVKLNETMQVLRALVGGK